MASMYMYTSSYCKLFILMTNNYTCIVDVGVVIAPLAWIFQSGKG